VTQSNLSEEFSGPLESLGCHLDDLFEAASQSNPNLVPTIEKAMERFESLRRLLRHLSRALPDQPSPSRFEQDQGPPATRKR